jgi:hypothetical protein
LPASPSDARRLHRCSAVPNSFHPSAALDEEERLLFLLLIALLSAAGAWMAWRRNPLYSTRFSLRMVAFVLLAIGALIAVLIAGVNLTAHSSPEVRVLTMGVIIVVCTLSLIAIIQTVSTPKEGRLMTKLPPSAKLVRVHRQKFYPWARFAAIVIAVLGILGVAIPGYVKYAFLTYAVIALFLALILLPVLYYAARSADRSLTALECDPWVHWRYTPDDWERWGRVQVERVKASPRRLDRAREKLRAKLLKAAPEVYFGHDGLFCDGVYTNWLTGNVYLTSASVDQRPPRSLLFRFEKPIPNPYSRAQVMPILRSVLIPPGSESDIARLQRELTSRCPKARISLC